MRRVLAIGFTVMLAVGVLIAQQPQNPMVRGEEHRRRPTQSVHLSETITTTPAKPIGSPMTARRERRSWA